MDCDKLIIELAEALQQDNKIGEEQDAIRAGYTSALLRICLSNEEAESDNKIRKLKLNMKQCISGGYFNPF